MDKAEIVIIGAGLAGLTLAHELKKAGISALLLEARPRLGGRIETISRESTTLELGATWFADKHQSLNRLIDELRLEKVVQEYGQHAIYELAAQPPVLYPIPAQPEVTYRIKGGSTELINALYNQLNPEQVRLGEAVTALDFKKEGVLITTITNRYEAQIVVNTLPPNLLVSNVHFSPALDPELVQVSKTTHTWMGESIKAGFFSKAPFWLEQNMATLYSQTGPFTELYDHSVEGGFAMKGFLDDRLAALNDQQREEMAMAQLAPFFKEIPTTTTSFVQKVWKKDSYTYAPYETEVFPHQNNGHMLLRKPQFDQRFFMAGSETAIAFPGYMDGAVEAAMRVSQHLILARQPQIQS